MAYTQFTETEALLLALNDDEERLEAYLLENFLPGELDNLSRACGLLKFAARDAAAELRERFNG